MKQQREIIAAWVLPICGPPLKNAMIRLRGDKIVEIGSSSQAPQHDQHIVVLPGLVNAHTHLEFSDLEKPLGTPGSSFAQWVTEVIQYRLLQDKLADRQQRKDAAIALGINESFAHGVKLIGEIATRPWISPAYDNDDARVVVQLEQLGFAASQAEERCAEVDAAKSKMSKLLEHVGLSPHAPYSVSPQLVAKLIASAVEANSVVSMHLAESKEELQFLETRSGPFAKLLDRLNLLGPDWQLANIDYCLRELSECSRGLVIHGNYLSERQLDFLASYPNLSVVHCPRTHAYFGHREISIDGMLERGIRIAVGTDSRASNPDLDLLEELRLIRRKFTHISSGEILRMGTLAGAEALGMDRQFGSLEIGKAPGVLGIEFQEPIVDDPEGALLEKPIKRRFWLDQL
jgi:cytosine/adenosine deaminase-related metal-dependent hydrolase